MIPAAFIIARITDTQGSTPRENGAYMLIAAQELLGSIGGGKLEQQVMVEARALLAETEIGEGDRRSPPSTPTRIHSRPNTGAMLRRTRPHPL